jgi:hypothetical protein
MDDLFEMMPVDHREGPAEKRVQLGIRIQVSGQETLCPVSPPCGSFEEFEREIRDLKGQLDRVLGQVKQNAQASRLQDKLDIRADMAPDEIWGILSRTEDEALFVEGFNSLDSEKRKAVAEHVLTSCNIFSGKAAVFSARYSDDTSLMQ